MARKKEEMPQQAQGTEQGGAQGARQEASSQAPARRGGSAPARFDREPMGWHPMTPFRRIFDDFDRLFEDMQRGFFGRSLLEPGRGLLEQGLAPIGRSRGAEMAAWAPPIEVRDAGKEYLISAELPGVDPGDVEIECTDEGIVLRGETREEETREEGGIYRSERRYGSFYRELPLPPDVNVEQAKADFQNGLLKIRLPKREEAQQRVRRIPIGGAEGPAQGGQEPRG